MKLLAAILAGTLGLLLTPNYKVVDSDKTIPKLSEGVAATTLLAQESDKPVQILIDSLGLKADIQQVGLDDENLMIVPNDNTSVSWYQYGPRPGEKGNAVIAGHNFWAGSKGVLGDLKSIGVNDRIEIKGESGKSLNFKVKKIDIFDTNHFPTDSIYNGKEGNNLVLITCHGQYDKRIRTYDKRLVVTAALD